MKDRITVFICDRDLEFIGELAEILYTSNITLKAADCQDILFEQLAVNHPDVIVIGSALETDSVSGTGAIVNKISDLYNIPVLILTAQSKISSIFGGDATDGILTKPLYLDDFVSSVQNITRKNTDLPFVHFAHAI